ncbi:hypothetical protein E3P94_03597 [Wallemia ichthyophaga]|nr:hypothetical protein E3P95_03590 [Wallemia ichthyophaga]TIA96712.1 hypothetical protein E3P94_03597 [Wallemia ichthyophaga]
MKPLPKAALFCANLPEQLADDDLKLQLSHLFSKYGRVHHVKLNRDRQNRLGAFIQYQLPSHADVALNKSNKIYLKDRLLRVERARVNRSLRISHTPLDSSAIQSTFCKHGDMESFLIGPAVGSVPEQSAEQGEFIVRFKFRDDCMAAWFAHRQSSLFHLSWAHERSRGVHSGHNTNNTLINDKGSFPPLVQSQQPKQITSHHTASDDAINSIGALDLASAPTNKAITASVDATPSVFLGARSESFPEMRQGKGGKGEVELHLPAGQEKQQSKEIVHPHDSPNTPSRFIPSTPQLSPDMNEANQSLETTSTHPLTPPSQPFYDTRPPRKSYGRGGAFEGRGRGGGFRRNNTRPPRPHNHNHNQHGKRYYLNMNYHEGGVGVGALGELGSSAAYYYPGYAAQQPNNLNLNLNHTQAQAQAQAYYTQQSQHSQSTPAFIPYPALNLNLCQAVMAYPYVMQQGQQGQGRGNKIGESNTDTMEMTMVDGGSGGVGIGASGNVGDVNANANAINAVQPIQTHAAHTAHTMNAIHPIHPGHTVHTMQTLMPPLRATGFMTTNAGLVPLYSPQDLERWNEGLIGSGSGTLGRTVGDAQLQQHQQQYSEQPEQPQESLKDNEKSAGNTANAKNAHNADTTTTTHYDQHNHSYPHSQSHSHSDHTNSALSLQPYPLLQQPRPQHVVNTNVGLGLDTAGVGRAPTGKNTGSVNPPRFFGVSPPSQPYQEWEGVNADSHTHNQHSHSHSHPSVSTAYYDNTSQPVQHTPPPPGFTTGPPGHTPGVYGRER